VLHFDVITHSFVDAIARAHTYTHTRALSLSLSLSDFDSLSLSRSRTWPTLLRVFLHLLPLPPKTQAMHRLFKFTMTRCFFRSVRVGACVLTFLCVCVCTQNIRENTRLWAALYTTCQIYRESVCVCVCARAIASTNE